jgi:hypothetical protein
MLTCVRMWSLSTPISHSQSSYVMTTGKGQDAFLVQVVEDLFGVGASAVSFTNIIHGGSIHMPASVAAFTHRPSRRFWKSRIEYI